VSFSTAGKIENLHKQSKLGETFVKSCGFQGNMSFSMMTSNFTENVTAVRSWIRHVHNNDEDNY